MCGLLGGAIDVYIIDYVRPRGSVPSFAQRMDAMA